MKFLFLILCVALITAEEVTVKTDRQEPIYRMPAEWEPHQRTFMVWPQSAQLWGVYFLADVRNDIARIANAIVPFEPVVMFVHPEQVSVAQRKLDLNVEIVTMKVDDLWARDTFPTFLSKLENGSESISGVIFNFNGWGNKQRHRHDAHVARKVLHLYGLESRTARVVGEGGSFETDGKGTLLVTKSSLVNENRNKKTLEEIEVELKNMLGMKKVIWLDGVKGGDITDGHVDGLVRFVKPGIVIINRPFPGEAANVWSQSSDQAFNVLERSTDADGLPFKIIELFEPNPRKITYDGDLTTFFKSYLNFYIGNGFVAVAKFGDIEADFNAQRIIQSQFPERVIVPIRIDNLAYGEGGIHCAVHEQPAARP